jgi:hypothetical protein
VQGLLAGGPAPVTAATTGAATPAAGIVGPYRSLFTNTVANLGNMGSIWANVTAPAVVRAITTQANPLPILGALSTGNPLTMVSATGQLAQGYANLLQNLTIPATVSITSLNPPNASVAIGVGLPELLAFDALGGPVNAALAASSSSTAILKAIQTGNPLAVINAFVDAPANITNAFLNGETTLPLPLPVTGLSMTADIPFGGLLTPLQPFGTTAALPANPVIQTVTITGPPVGGFLPALLLYTPQLLASAFGG